MTAVLTVRLDNQATGGLQGLERELTKTAQLSADVAVETRVLTDAQKEQIQVIHEHRAAWSQLIARVGPGLLQLTEGATTLGVAYWQLRGRAQSLGVAKRVVETAALRAASALTRVGGPVAVLYTGYKGLSLILDNTGKSLKQSSDATDDQKEAFERLRIEAVTTGNSIQRMAKQQGVDLADLAVTSESNLDRVHKAAGGLGSTLARPFAEGAKAAGNLASSLNPLPGIWQAIDKAATSATDGIVAGTDAASAGAQSLIDNLRSVAATGMAGNKDYLKEVQQLRELETLHERLNKQREEEREHFGRLRSANDALSESRKAAAEAARLSSLDTLAAIDGEMDKQRAAAGQRASARDFDAEAQSAYTNRMNYLEAQRTQIVRREAEKRKELLERIREETESREKAAIERRARDEGAAVIASIERYNKWAEEVRDAHKRANDFAREFADTANNSILEAHIHRLESEEGREEEAHRAKLELIQQEIDQRIAAADTIEGREQAFYDGLLRMQREQLQHQRAAITAEIDARKEAAAKALEIEKQKQDAIKNALQSAGVADGQQMLQQIDPRRALMDQRGRAAADAARKSVLNDPENAALRSQALVDVAAGRRLRAMQERAAREAERSARAGAYRDIRRGNVDPAELVQAQANAGKETISALQQNGQLSTDVAKILAENLQAAANTQAVTASLQAQIDQMKPAAKGIMTVSQQQRNRATKGGLN